MASGNRLDRVSQLVKEVVSEVLRGELKDPRIGFVTVTRVEVTADLRTAKVFVSILGTDEEQQQSVQGLSSASGFVRRALGNQMHTRYTPELRFILDKSVEASDRMTHLLSELERSPEPSTERLPERREEGEDEH